MELWNAATVVASRSGWFQWTSTTRTAVQVGRPGLG
jgi:hypothetical protein